MLKIHSAISLIFLGILSLFVMGCSASTRLTEVVNIPNEKWRITIVTVSKSDLGWHVRGRLNSPSIFGLPDGYIVVSLVSNNGTLLEEKTTDYRRITGNAGRHRRHQYGVALFSVDFESIPEGAKVVAEHRMKKTK